MGELERTLTTKGLGLKMNPDGESYSLVSVGDCEETDIFVGFCEDGLPVTVIESEALDSARIESITLGECVHTVGEKAFYYCCKLKSVKMTGVERIEWLAFDNCRALSEVDFGKKLTFIAERAFEGCRSLSAVNLPGTISEIGASAFSGLPLEVASIEGAEDNEYEPILWSGRLADMLSDRNARVIRRRKEGSEAVPEGAVVNTTGLSVYLSADGKSYIADGWGTMDFYTKEVNIGYHIDGRPVKGIAKDAFARVERAGIEAVRIGGTVEKIGSGAFYYAVFESLELSEGLREIGDYAFYAGGFGELKIPSTVEKIGKHAFHGCRRVKGELVLPAGLTRIEEESFTRMFEITGEVKIPRGVKYIGAEAFAFDLRIDGIVFEDPEGWVYEGEPVDLSDPKKNAELLTDIGAKEMEKLG